MHGRERREPRGGSRERFPSHSLSFAVSGDLPRENFENCDAGEAFLSLLLVKISGFKLDFESQFEFLYEIFCFNLAQNQNCLLVIRPKTTIPQDQRQSFTRKR